MQGSTTRNPYRGCPMRCARNAGGWLLLCGALIFGAACQPAETQADRGVRTNTLFVGNGTEPATLDPHLALGVTEHDILRALFEGLVTRDGKDLSILPGVASAWEISDDGRIYTFTLDTAARWSNGDPVTADDFAFSFERMLNPLLGSTYAKMLYPLKNAEAYNRGEIDDFAEVGVEAVDAETLILTLERPLPYFLDLLAHGSWYPVHPPTVKAHGDVYGRTNRWARAGTLVGNGPFQLADWQLNRHIIVERNAHYRNAGQVRLDAIHFLPITSADTEERAFRAGFLHLTHSVPPHRIDHHLRNRPDAIHFDTYLGTYYYLLNVRNPPLDNPLVRRALAYTIDRESIVENILRGGQKPAFHFTPPETAGYTSPATQSYDPERARELLAEAGFPDGEGFPELEILYNTSDQHREIALAIQQMWRRELGITIRLHNEEWKVYLDSRIAGRFDILRAGWIGDYNDPSTFLNLFVAGSPQNHSGWAAADYDAAIERAGANSDPSKRHAAFAEAEALLLDSGPVIPIYFYVRSLLLDERVRGRHANVLDYHPWQNLYFAGDDAASTSHREENPH